jgi:hypothetical protein
MKRGFRIVLALSAALAGCGGRESGVYQISAHDAYQRLLGSELPELVMARQCGILIHPRSEGVADRSVTWRVYSSGREMVNFTATLTPLDAGRTRVEISVGRNSHGQEAYDGSLFYTRPAFNQPLRPAVEEQVAALLEGRSFDVTRVPRGTDSVCDVQRAGLEEGTEHFSVTDRPASETQGLPAARPEPEPDGAKG